MELKSPAIMNTPSNTIPLRLVMEISIFWIRIVLYFGIKISNMFRNSLSQILFNGFLIILVSGLLLNCAGTYILTNEDLIIEMEKTPCYGQCPVYTIKIDKNGKGLFEGVENTEKTGTFRFSLSGEELERLVTSFREIRFFEMEDEYYRPVSDLPTTYLSHYADGAQKKIKDYAGAPPELKSLEQEIETLVLSRKMKKVR